MTKKSQQIKETYGGVICQEKNGRWNAGIVTDLAHRICPFIDPQNHNGCCTPLLTGVGGGGVRAFSRNGDGKGGRGRVGMYIIPCPPLGTNKSVCREPMLPKSPTLWIFSQSKIQKTKQFEFYADFHASFLHFKDFFDLRFEFQALFQNLGRL